MDLTLQGSLLDLTDEMGLRDLGTGLTRHQLTRGAWVDVRPGWLCAGDELFTTLLHDVPWHAERRQMYDSIVDVPRLTRFYAADEALPHPLLVEAREALSRHYASELGEPFATAGLCLYRDGRDSVAWHGDRIGRSRDTRHDGRHPLPRLRTHAGATSARRRTHPRVERKELALPARAW